VSLSESALWFFAGSKVERHFGRDRLRHPDSILVSLAKSAAPTQRKPSAEHHTDNLGCRDQPESPQKLKKNIALEGGVKGFNARMNIFVIFDSAAPT